MAHTASTAVSRYFERRRGKALSYIWLGMSLGEFLLPILIVYLLSLIYWRDLWIQTSIVILLILPLFSYFTVKDIGIYSREKENQKDINKFTSVKSWTRREVISDFKFYTMLPALLAPSFIITGIVINQSFIIESKGWGEYAIAKAFMIYSVITVITLFLSGLLVDKFTSRKLLPILNIPLLLSLITLMILKHSYTAFIFMGLLGVTNGLTNVLLSSLWAEIYGVKYLGSIKALTGSLMVFSTALATIIFGLLIDLSFSIEDIAALCSVYTAISITLVLIFKKKYEPVPQNIT
jgi:MFS family permease